MIRGLLCALAISISIPFPSCFGQNITDVEAKPYGAYTGGQIDTIDLATGNVMLNIPLISFPQKGSLPPLTFSVASNNAPYSQGSTCDPSNGCYFLSSRYDTAPPGGVYQYYFNPVGVTCGPADISCSSIPCPDGQSTCQPQAWGTKMGPIQNMGVYLTSSYAGGIVTGTQLYQDSGISNVPAGTAEIVYTAIDGSGTSHVLASDATNPNIFRAPDGSGFTFKPNSNGYDLYSQDNSGLGTTPSTQSWNNWLTNPVVFTTAGTGINGVRLGTLYSPAGINYTNTILQFDRPSSDNANNPLQLPPRALQTAIMDPSGNTITRGPWYWSAYWSIPPTTGSPSCSGNICFTTPLVDAGTEFSNIQAIYATNPPVFHDSVGRTIPDVIALQSAMTGSSIDWTVKGQDGRDLKYTINYVQMSGAQNWTTQQDGVPPDPMTDVDQSGWSIHSIVLPNGTNWTFNYSGPGIGYDLTEVDTPGGGKISYTYTSWPSYSTPQQLSTSVLQLSRCNGVCHAVQSRTEDDGQGHSWKTSYSYGVLSQLPGCDPYVTPTGVQRLYAFYTIETDANNNDTVHNFCGLGTASGVGAVANRYHEILTQYYEKSSPLNTSATAVPGALLKSVATSFEYQPELGTYVSSGQIPGITNVLPTTVVTTTPSTTSTGTPSTVSVTDTRQYSIDSGTPLFTANNVACGGSEPCTLLLGHTAASTTETAVSSSYDVPTQETITDAQSSVLHTTSTTFEFENPSSQAYLDKNLIALPRTVTVSSGDIARGVTTYGYDESDIQGSCSHTAQAAPWGNQTSKIETYFMQGGSTSTSSIATQAAYNCDGMPVTTIDGRNYSTFITYDSTGLFASKIQRPSTDAVQHIDYYSYDSNTGNLNWHTDENGAGPVDATHPDLAHTTKYSYDLMGRVTAIQYPDGGGSNFCYSDIGGPSLDSEGLYPCPKQPAPFSLSTYTLASSDPTTSIRTIHKYDGWGRQYTSSVLSDPQGATTVDTAFDFAGRVISVTNPYRSTPASTDGMTTFSYDALGRKTLQVQPDNTSEHPSLIQWCYNNIATAGQSNCTRAAMQTGSFVPTDWTDISDETGRHSQQLFDGAGRLSAVVEADPDSGALGLETDYSYDTFGDLTQVHQMGGLGYTNQMVTRLFSYDRPSRVTLAQNPEVTAPAVAGQNWVNNAALSYSYDANSNLIHKTDARGISTTYAYDELNRLLSKTYSGDSTGTASSCYQYDGAQSSNLSGRLVAQWTQNGSCASSLPGTGVLSKSAISLYDAMGRIKNEQRCVGVSDCIGSGYWMTYNYDLAGKLLSYPSGYGGYTFTNSYDSAGRLSSVTGTVASQTTSLFTVPSYTPAGALAGVQLGSSVNVANTFDSRQRITGETASR